MNEPGMLSPGNINLANRPRVQNPDGSISTVRSVSFGLDGKEVLLPTVSEDGRIVSNDEAIKQYRDTGRHLGMFRDPASATAYANKLHNAQASFVTRPPSPADDWDAIASNKEFRQQTPEVQLDVATNWFKKNAKPLIPREHQEQAFTEFKDENFPRKEFAAADKWSPLDKAPMREKLAHVYDSGREEFAHLAPVAKDLSRIVGKAGQTVKAYANQELAKSRADLGLSMSMVNALAGTLTPGIGPYHPGVQRAWQGVKEYGEASHLDEISDAMMVAGLFVGGVEAIEAAPEFYAQGRAMLGAKFDTAYRAMASRFNPQRGVMAIPSLKDAVPDEALLNLYKTAPEEIRNTMLRMNPRMQNIVAQADKEASGAMRGGAVSPIRVSSQDHASIVMGASVLGPEEQKLAQENNALYQIASGRAAIPRASQAKVQNLINHLDQKKIPPGPLVARLKYGASTGETHPIIVGQTSDGILQDALDEQGAHADTHGRHRDEGQTAASRPAETLVAIHAEGLDRKALNDAQDSIQAARKQAQEAAQAAAVAPPAPFMAPEPLEPPADPKERHLGFAFDPNSTPEQGKFRLQDPHEFKPGTIRETQEWAGKKAPSGITFEIGEHENGQIALKEIRFDKSRWPERAAEKWWKEHQEEEGFEKVWSPNQWTPERMLQDHMYELAEKGMPAVPVAEKPIYELTRKEFEAKFPGFPQDAFDLYRGRLEEERSDMGVKELRKATKDISPKPVHDALRHFPISKKAIRKLGLASEFGLTRGDLRYKGISTDKGGLLVDQALTMLKEQGALPEDATINDMTEALDTEDRKGTKAEAKKAMLAGRRQTVMAARETKYGKEVMALPGAPESEMVLSFGGKSYPINSVSQASEMWDKVRDEAMSGGLGSRDLSSSPKILGADGKTMGWVSWNGRIWKGEPGDTSAEWKDAPDISEVRPALRDPKTGTVYQGSAVEGHRGIVAKVEDPAVRGRLESAIPDKDGDAGFVVDGHFYTRKQTLEHFGFAHSQELVGLAERKAKYEAQAMLPGLAVQREMPTGAATAKTDQAAPETHLASFKPEAQGDLFDAAGNVNPEAVSWPAEVAPAPSQATPATAVYAEPGKGDWSAVEADAKKAALQNKSNLTGEMADLKWQQGWRPPEGMGVPGSETRNRWDAAFKAEVDSWKTPAKPSAPAASGKSDVGQELWMNRRNIWGKGINWDDVKGLNPTLRVAEVQKTKVWPRPDYEEFVDGGMQPFTAHLVKQVYDSIASKPYATDDASMELYVNEVQRVKEAVFNWAKDTSAQRSMIGALASEAGVMAKRQFSITELMDKRADTDSLLNAIYPAVQGKERFRGDIPQAKDNLSRVRAIGAQKVIDAMRIDTGSARKALEAIKEGWPKPQEMWQKRFDVGVLAKGSKYGQRNAAGQMETITASEDTYYVTPKNSGRILADGFKTKAEAEAKAKELAEVKKGPRQVEASLNMADIQRRGPVRRPDGLDAKPKDLMWVFGFRGVNFGNWVNPAEAQVFTNHGYDALADLADLLNIPPKAIALDGILGLAFGAQGTGGKGAAAAHFIAGVNEINLTKTNGAGTVAHEWAHALDHYFTVQAGGDLAKSKSPFLTSFARMPSETPGLRPEIRQAFKDIMDAMTKRMETPEEAAKRIKDRDAKNLNYLNSWLDHFRSDLAKTKIYDKKGGSTELDPEVKKKALSDFDAIAERMRAGDVGNGREKMGRGIMSDISQATGELRRLFKDVTGRAPDPDRLRGLDANAGSRQYLKSAEGQEKLHVPQEVETSYVKEGGALEAVKGGAEYWLKPTELFARAFTSYVQDKLMAKAAQNDFLSRPQLPTHIYKEPAFGFGGDPYPRGVERDKINAAFDTLVGEIKTKETGRGTALYGVAAAVGAGVAAAAESKEDKE